MLTLDLLKHMNLLDYLMHIINSKIKLGTKLGTKLGIKLGTKLDMLIRL